MPMTVFGLRGNEIIDVFYVFNATTFAVFVLRDDIVTVQKVYRSII